MLCDRAATRSRRIKGPLLRSSSGTLTAETSLSEQSARGRRDKNRLGRKKKFYKNGVQMMRGFGSPEPGLAEPGSSKMLRASRFPRHVELTPPSMSSSGHFLGIQHRSISSIILPQSSVIDAGCKCCCGSVWEWPSKPFLARQFPANCGKRTLAASFANTLETSSPLLSFVLSRAHFACLCGWFACAWEGVGGSNPPLGGMGCGRERSH